MRAMTISKDHRLESADLPEPVPADGEVLIDVVAAGVNRADLVQVAGKYPPPPGASPLPGLEVSGRYAEVVAVPHEQLLPAPPGLSLVDAAGLIEVAATVVSNLVIEAGVPVDGAASQTVLVHGGTGGIGSFAIQLAHVLGHRVLTTVGSDAGVEQALKLGADQAWNRHTTDVRAAVSEAGGADVILDVVGPALATTCTCCASMVA
jgi:NADPH:quinone reductase-like Zn-dependent oxidoreductase